MMDNRQLAEAVRDAAMGVQECDITQGSLRRFVLIKPEFSCLNECAFDKPDCRPGSGGYHGQGARIITFGVAVEGVGGVTAEIFTPICVDDVETEKYLDLWSPLGGVDCHWAANPPEYLRGGLFPLDGCKVTGGDCWPDGTGLMADKIVERFLSGGALAVWSWLAETRLPDLTHGAAS
jgi:hypothetical protein